MGIFPNPANAEINIQTVAMLDSVELCDLAGHVISSVKPTSANAQISTVGLATGIYLLRGKNGNSFSSQLISITH